MWRRERGSAEDKWREEDKGKKGGRERGGQGSIIMVHTVGGPSPNLDISECIIDT